MLDSTILDEIQVGFLETGQGSIMTKKDDLLRTLRRNGFDKVPCDMVLAPPKEEEFHRRMPGTSIPEYYGLSHRTSVREYIPGYQGDGKELFSHLHLPERFEVDPFGVGMSYGSEAAFHMCHFHSPLEGEGTTLSQIQDYALPVLTPGTDKNWEAFVQDCHARELAAMGTLEQTIWERAWLIRGMNDLMMDMMSDDDKATCILDRITEHACIAATLYAKTGHDIIALGDDVGMQNTVMMSQKLWRLWLKPRLARVIEVIKTENPEILIFYHSCGFVEPFIPELIEIGVDILNPVQPECMDFETVHKRYGQELSFWGGIGTQTTFPFGSPDDVRHAVRRLVEVCGDAGGLVVGPTHVLEPEVPWDNQEAMLDEVRTINGTLN
jgi:uroporphyrinogen decarboxylase